MRKIKSLSWNLNDISNALDIKIGAVDRFLRDGRNASFLLKFSLSKYLRWDLVEGYNAPTHLLDLQGNEWSIRSCTPTSGVSFCANTMIGSGRKFKALEFISDLKEISGFLVGVMENFPKVDVYMVTSKEVLDMYEHGALRSGRMSNKQFKKFAKIATLEE